MLTLEDYSRLIFTQPVIFDGKLTYGTWKRPNFLVNPIPKEFERTLRVTAQYEGRCDNLAQDLYGISALDWVFPAYNNAVEVLNWPRAGTIIKYPDVTIVLAGLA
jgi:hypothetical protein